MQKTKVIHKNLNSSILEWKQFVEDIRIIISKTELNKNTKVL